MSAAPRVRIAPESGVVRRSEFGALGAALAQLAASSGCNATVLFSLEGDDLLPYSSDGELPSLRIDADDRRSIARPLATRRIEKVRGLGFLPSGLEHALLVPLAVKGEVVGVACLAYRDAPIGELCCDGEIELLGLALANDVAKIRENLDNGDLRELARLASIGMFLVGVTHELRGPAGALALLVPELASAIRGEKTPEEARALIRDLDKCSERVVELSIRLRGAGRRDRQRGIVDLAEVARDAVALARIHAPEIAFTLVEGSDPVLVFGVRAELDQIAMNLLLNAVDACRAEVGKPARVDITVLADEGSATLTLSDSGPGILPELEEKVFERFFTTKPRGSGTGVGLSMSREIAEAHAGELALVPSRGGATFMMRLPLHAREAGRPMLVREMRGTTPRREANDGGTDIRRVKVLLVDDDPLVLRTHRRALSAFEVRGASSVAEAVRELETNEIDVVVSDLGMTDGGGVALHHWMVEHLGAKRPPMLFLTGGITHSRLQTAVDATGCRCLTKPTPMDALVAAIRHAAAARRA